MNTAIKTIIESTGWNDILDIIYTEIDEACDVRNIKDGDTKSPILASKIIEKAILKVNQSAQDLNKDKKTYI